MCLRRTYNALDVHGATSYGGGTNYPIMIKHPFGTLKRIMHTSGTWMYAESVHFWREPEHLNAAGPGRLYQGEVALR
jgi:hypothetical protein